MKKRVTHEIPIEADEPVRERSKPEAAQTPASPAVPEASGASSASAPGPAPDYREVVDHLQRLQAEFANYRRRVEKERLDTVESAQHALVEKLIPVLDDFERAVGAIEDPSNPTAKGLLLIWDKFSKILAEAGLARIDARGAAFDPQIHEALATQPVEASRVEQVVEELVPGYTFRGRLVRPARVCVGMEASKSGDDPGGE